MMKTLHGRIVIKEDIPVSPDDQVNLRIEDVSRMDVASVLIAETQLLISTAEHEAVCTSPISFSIDYDETKIQENMSYTIRAIIRNKEGNLLWITDVHTPVFTRGGPLDNVDVSVKRVAE